MSWSLSSPVAVMHRPPSTTSNEPLLHFFDDDRPKTFRSWAREHDCRGGSFHVTRRRVCLVISLFLVSSITVVLVLSLLYDQGPTKIIHGALSNAWSQPSKSEDWGDAEESSSRISLHSSMLKGPPTKSFRENLLPDMKYITSWTSAGWTNDVMTYINLIYIARLTDRIPILPAFYPSHLPNSAGPIEVGRVFDLQKLSRAINLPILEWSQVKDSNATDTVVDDLGCWSAWATSNPNANAPRGNKQEQSLQLDVSYTPVPKEVKLFPQSSHDWHLSIWGLAKLAFPQSRKKALKGKPAQWRSKLHNHAHPPDEHLLCYDFIYFTSVHMAYEYAEDFSPEWRFVGTHLDWSRTVKEIGDEYLRRALNVKPNESVPPYIGMHVRHKDFYSACKSKGTPVDDCFASLDAYARRAEEVRAELYSVPSFNFTVEEAASLPVIVTSDEDTGYFWEDAYDHGWIRIDHTVEGTEEKYGKWYTAILDAYFQSRGVGFVGTERSTMSLLAQRRVEDWWGGIAREVRWGSKDADAH